MWFLENLVLTKHYKTGPKNCSAADCHEIKIVNYTKEDYEEVISIFKSGCYERISYSLTHGWKKPRVVMFLSTSFLLIPISVKYAIICLILLWSLHAYSIYRSDLLWVQLVPYEYWHERQSTPILDHTFQCLSFSQGKFIQRNKIQNIHPTFRDVILGFSITLESGIFLKKCKIPKYSIWSTF